MLRKMSQDSEEGNDLGEEGQKEQTTPQSQERNTKSTHSNTTTGITTTTTPNPIHRSPSPPPPAPRRVLTPLVKSVGSFFSNRRLAREKREAQARVDEMRKQVLEEDEFMAKIRARDELIRLRREQHQVTLDEERR